MVTADGAIRVARIVLGVVAAFVVAGYRPLTEGTLTSSTLVVVAAIGVGTVLVDIASRQALRRERLRVVQLVDVVAFLGLAVVTAGPLGGLSWVVLVVPTVAAAVRLGAVEVVASWAVGVGAYLVLARIGWVDTLTPADHLRVPGVLLAVAVPLALLARWMHEGWAIQADLTTAAVERERRTRVIAAAAQSLADIDVHLLAETDLVEGAAEHIRELGFDAVTTHRSGEIRHGLLVGAVDSVAAELDVDGVSADGVLVTIWTDDGHARSHSASTIERHSGTIITGWSHQPISEELAASFSALVGHLSAAIASRELLTVLRRRATRDPLTGLYNRAQFDAELDAAATRSGPLSLMFVDLDDFKMINDRHGHSSGDRALATIADRLDDIVGDAGVVGRFGGDEFVVLLPRLEPGIVDAMAQAIVCSAAAPIEVVDAEIALEISIGVAHARGPIEPADLVRTADLAMYRSKRGDGGVVTAEVPGRRVDASSTATTDRPVPLPPPIRSETPLARVPVS